MHRLSLKQFGFSVLLFPVLGIGSGVIVKLRLPSFAFLLRKLSQIKVTGSIFLKNK